MRIIDGDELLKKKKLLNEHYNFRQVVSVEDIEEAPIICENIVKCKNCEFSDYWYEKLRCYLWAYDGIDVLDDGFCNYGKEKEENKLTELKPCPFCGGEAKIVEYYIKGVANKKHYFVECKNCGVRRDNHHDGYRTRQDVINAWNRREENDD